MTCVLKYRFEKLNESTRHCLFNNNRSNHEVKRQKINFVISFVDAKRDISCWFHTQNLFNSNSNNTKNDYVKCHSQSHTLRMRAKTKTQRDKMKIGTKKKSKRDTNYERLVILFFFLNFSFILKITTEIYIDDILSHKYTKYTTKKKERKKKNWWLIHTNTHTKDKSTTTRTRTTSTEKIK